MRPGDQKTFDGKRAAAIDPAVKWEVCADRHKRLAGVIRPLLTRKPPAIGAPTPLVGQPVEPVQPRKSLFSFLGS